MRTKKASHNLYNETGMNSLFSVLKLIGNMFFDSFFDTISPEKIGCIVKSLVLLIGKRVKEIDEILIGNKTTHWFPGLKYRFGWWRNASFDVNDYPSRHDKRLCRNASHVMIQA